MFCGAQELNFEILKKTQYFYRVEKNMCQSTMKLEHCSRRDSIAINVFTKNMKKKSMSKKQLKKTDQKKH